MAEHSKSWYIQIAPFSIRFIITMAMYRVLQA